jgi:hypothetical protein
MREQFRRLHVRGRVVHVETGHRQHSLLEPQEKPFDKGMHVTIPLGRNVSPRKRYTFFIDDEIAIGLKVLKERDGISESEAVRRAIAEFLAVRRITVGTKAERKRAATRRRP